MKTDIGGKLAEYVENHAIDIYVDYRDELNEIQVQRILDGHALEVRDELEMDYDSYGEDYKYYWEACSDEIGVTQEEIDEWLEEDGFYPSYTLDDHDWRTLVRNTKVYIRATVPEATWCFNNWAYGAPIEYTYFKEALKILGINPYEFRALKSGGGNTTGEGQFKGWWPNLPNRVPKVNVEDLYKEVIVLYDGVMNFMLGDLEEVIEVTSSDSKNLVFKKGTPVVMYDLFNGAGIVDVPLIEDLTIARKLVAFDNDGASRYGIQACYGFVGSYWKEGSVANGE